MRSNELPFEVLILGGGPAGMAAALVSGRARLRTLVINAEAPRNAVTHASHGFLTRDGAHPTELLAIAKAQLRKYPSVEYVAGLAIGVDRTEDGLFRVGIEGGRVAIARRVVVATGYSDRLETLRLPGIREVYGRSVYPCPFCDGFENADKALAVFGADGMEHFVPVVAVWSPDVALFTNGTELNAAARAEFDTRGVPVYEQRVERLECDDDGQLTAVLLVDGQRIRRQAGFLGKDYTVPTTDFAARLGVPTTINEWGMEVLEADETGKTVVDKVYVVGDARTGFAGLMASAAEGSACAAAIVHGVAAERWSARPLSGPG